MGTTGHEPIPKSTIDMVSSLRVPLLERIQHYRNHTSAFQLTLLAGDIHPNPGPQTRGSHPRESVLKCLSLNARSIKRMTKREAFQSLTYRNDLDIIAVCETWLDSEIIDQDVLPTGYDLCRNGRPD